MFLTVGIEKIGKQEGEESFRTIALPIVRARPDLFPNPDLFTVDLFHHMGSLILSRSFTVEPIEIPGEEDVSMEKSNTSLPDTSIEMNASTEEEEEEDGAADVAMVPFADILNARSGHHNAQLVYELETLDMTATRDIPQGEQI